MVAFPAREVPKNAVAPPAAPLAREGLFAMVAVPALAAEKKVVMPPNVEMALPALVIVIAPAEAREEKRSSLPTACTVTGPDPRPSPFGFVICRIPPATLVPPL